MRVMTKLKRNFSNFLKTITVCSILYFVLSLITIGLPFLSKGLVINYGEVGLQNGKFAGSKPVVPLPPPSVLLKLQATA